MKHQKKELFLKVPTGISGLDEITDGGFPKGRPILICGTAGCGKTLFATQFIIKGITDFNEPGVIMTFEESGMDLILNARSIGFDLAQLQEEKKLKIDHVRIERSEIEETGEYDLEALFIRLNYAIDSVGAKRVVLDTIESLFAGMSDPGLLRAEIRRLFQWLKKKGVTTIITAERGEGTLTRHGLEEYVSDCVILLDARVIDQIATRRLRIVKYRGSSHGTNEYPFLIENEGVFVIPVTSLKLEHKSSREVVSTGHPQLDKIFSKGGVFRGSSILITGTAGTAKTILAAYFAYSSCLRNERVLYFSFEESPDQFLRNMASVGLHLKPFVNSKLLYIYASRPSLQGLEMHLLTFHKLMVAFEPKTFIIDPISSLVTVGSNSEVRAMLVRLMDTLKTKQISAMFTSLMHQRSSLYDDVTVDAVSSLCDTWINISNEIQNNERSRNLLIVKSRGMGHLNNAQEFIITNKGIKFQNTNQK